MNRFELTKDWQEVAAGPCQIETEKGMALIHVDDAQPAADTRAFFRVGDLRPPHLAQPFAKKSWARATQDDVVIIVLEEG